MALVPQATFAVPTLHYGYLPGCPACALASVAVDQLEREAPWTLRVRRVNLAAGAPFPIPVNSAPAFVLELPGSGTYQQQPPRRDYAGLKGWLASAARSLRTAARSNGAR